CRSLPVRKDDEVEVVRGTHAGHKGKIVSVYRRKWVIHVDKLVKDKANNTSAPLGVDPSKVKIISLKLDKDRLNLLERKDRSTKVVRA
ncbi:hypothetical protein HDU76_005867, partial [Blyttiomyces sp. JEL0837]